MILVQKENHEPKLTLWICTERNLTAASRTADEESVDGNIEVSLLQSLLSRIEFSAPVDVLAAISTLHGKRCHQSDCDDLRSLLPEVLWCPPDRRRIEVGRVVFCQDFSLRHLGGCLVGDVVWRIPAKLVQCRGRYEEVALNDVIGRKIKSRVSVPLT